MTNEKFGLLLQAICAITVKLFIGFFHFYNSKFKGKTSNTYSASYSMGSCPLAIVIVFPQILEMLVIQTKLTAIKDYSNQSQCFIQHGLI